MSSMLSKTPSNRELLEANRRFYDALWAVYGMRPRSSRLVNLGMWGLTHQRERAMWWYNRVMMPLAVRFAKKLALAPGMIDTERVDEVLLVCRRDSAPRSKSANQDHERAGSASNSGAMLASARNGVW